MTLRVLRGVMVLVLVVALAGAGSWTFLHFFRGYGLGSLLAAPPPSATAPVIGVGYRVDIGCTPSEFQLGDTVWGVVLQGEKQVPAAPDDPGGIQHDVPRIPGVARAVSATAGVFASDVDGSEWPIRFVRHGELGFMCL
jgi:hypothetical protein